MRKIAILVDNILRENSFQLILKSCSDFQIVDSHLGLFNIIQSNPDIILMEVLLGADSNHILNLIHQIRSHTTSKIIITSDRRQSLLFRLTNCLVNAIVISDVSWNIYSQNLIDAIYNVIQGRNWLDPVIAGIIIQSKITSTTNFAVIDENGQRQPKSRCCEYRLTDKERQILYAIASGQKNQEIADNLNVALPTIKTHINNIQRKMGTNTRVYTVVQGLLDGVIELSEIKIEFRSQNSEIRSNYFEN